MPSVTGWSEAKKLSSNVMSSFAGARDHVSGHRNDIGLRNVGLVEHCLESVTSADASRAMSAIDS